MNDKPLADAMRPAELTEFMGQEHLRERIEKLLNSGRLPSLLLFGPPGCGKSSLALLLATSTGKNFLRLSAPEAGIAQLRGRLEGIDILVLDELHRFSKAQQDFFLPLLETGALTLIATTTENPSFSVTRQLLSRLHTLRLNPLSPGELEKIGDKALEKTGNYLPGDSVKLLAQGANGDARTMLNLLEFAMGLPKEQQNRKELIKLLPDVLLRHDKDGDNHYELASALIKSIRGSDVDAALYYLACLLEGGEDPRFVCRRLILSASEDVGLADPQALPLAVACQQAVEFVGMPEGVIPLAETVVYLSLARKSNSTYAAYRTASMEVRKNGTLPVPLHLRNASTALQKVWGYGADYKYPHQTPESWVPQQYLPEEIRGARFYVPKNNGVEPALCSWWRKLHNIGQGKTSR